MVRVLKGYKGLRRAAEGLIAMGACGVVYIDNKEVLCRAKWRVFKFTGVRLSGY
jgi:hypothetical protein